MALNYTTLQAAILAQAVRSELTTEVVGFVRLAEGLIRREVRASPTRITLDESDRSSEGIYTLPQTVQEVRAIFVPNGSDSYGLENVGIHGIRMLPADADVLHYGVAGSTIEFRGVPATDFELDVIGLGWPEELATTATNDLLTYHEALYLYGGLFYLYQFTQDLELAQQAREVFTDARVQVNRMIDRKHGGGSVLPAYNFGHVTTSRGY